MEHCLTAVAVYGRIHPPPQGDGILSGDEVCIVWGIFFKLEVKWDKSKKKNNKLPVAIHGEN